MTVLEHVEAIVIEWTLGGIPLHSDTAGLFEAASIYIRMHHKKHHKSVADTAWLYRNVSPNELRELISIAYSRSRMDTE